MCWGILDFREEKVHPCTDIPRAKKFLSEAEIQNLQQNINEIIKKESNLNLSSCALLEVLQSSELFSIQEFSKEKRAKGMDGIQNLLKSNIEDDTSLQNLNIYDDDTQYIGECLDVT